MTTYNHISLNNVRMMNLVPTILSTIHGEARVCQLRREGLQTQLSVDVGSFLAIGECGPGFDLV